MTSVPESSGGSDGTLPPDFVPWHRGVTCTVRPEWLAPIDPDHIYLANVTVQRAAPSGEPFTGYGSLYRQALTIVQQHQRHRAGTATPQTWLQAHAWFRIEMPETALVSATVTLGLCVNEYARRQEGELPPSAEDLERPSGHTPESLARKHEDSSGQRRVDHLYTDFDRTGGASADFTLSYGEYAHDSPSDYNAFLGRADGFARSYDSSLGVLMREWRATRTGKTTDLPWIVVVESYLRRR